MAKVEKTRKNLKAKRGNIIETIDKIIQRAEYLVKSYDNMMINAFRKRIGASEYERLYKIATQNIELCIEELKAKITNSKKTPSPNDIERLIAVLKELNVRLVDAPKDYKEACMLGRISVIKLDMRLLIEEWNKSKRKCAELCEQLESVTGEERDALTARLYSIIEVIEQEIKKTIADALEVTDFIKSKSKSTNEALKINATNAGFLLPQGSISKEDMAKILENKLSTIRNTNLQIEYRLVIETIRALGTFETDFISLYRELDGVLPAEIASIREQFNSHTIVADAQVARIMAYDSTLLNPASLVRTSTFVTIESGAAKRLEAAKEEHRQEEKTRRLNIFTSRISRAISPFKKILSILENAYLSKEEPKSLVNNPISKKEEAN